MSQPTTVEVGTLTLTYLNGKNGPRELTLVRIDDYERVLRIIDTYRLLRRLHELRGSVEAMNILHSAGIDPARVQPPVALVITLTTFRVQNGGTGLVSTGTVQVKAFDLHSAAFTRTFAAQLQR